MTLLAIADFANDEGVAWPSIETLQRKTRLSRRSVQGAIKAMVTSGELRVRENAGPHGVHVYQLGAQILHSANSARVQNTTPRGAKSARGGCKIPREGGANSAPEPSLEPSIEPSERERAREADGDPPAVPPSPSRPLTPKEINALPDDDPVKVYRLHADRHPGTSQVKAIRAQLPNPAPPLWAKCIDAWMLAGYRSQNVKGMLDWYEQGGPPDSKGNGHGARASPQKQHRPGYDLSNIPEDYYDH